MELAEQKQRVNIGEQYRAVGKFGEQGEVKKIALSVKQHRITCFQTQQFVRTAECFCII